MPEEQWYKYGKHLGELERDGKSAKVFKLPLVNLVDEPDFVGMNKREFKALVASIREHGLLKPIVVTPCSSYAEPGGRFDINSHGKYRVVVGHNRCRAYMLLGFDTIECLIWDRPGIHNNCSKLTPIEPMVW